MGGKMGNPLPSPTESAEQMQLFAWAAWQAGRYPELSWLYHIPNGGKRTKATGGRLKAEGVKSGVPDLCLPVARGRFHGLYIELKRERGNSTTENQERWLEFLKVQGYCAVVCHGCEEAAAVLLGYLQMEKEEES